ncbi:glycine zipper family protein [Paraburkholderia phenazinium]|uniref:Glycine-zipper containing OmpA-like membrane domain-containing protein n=1 Tax=Paraburkholderia phenazinium TaxID=60549 RepID=A0A1G8JV56_9BURK|nr:glycine zipper family protein [Paraburkholderia phenazinium]SDI35092.1 Glycine-zipper containing OmpA-like membrane domain-containing protein [Paraburkholderia phenazinium]
MNRLTLTLLGTLACIGGCAVTPAGPTVMALPGSAKTFDQFRGDDASCRQYAFQQVGGVSTNQAATASAQGSAAVGTAVGAAAGAAFNGGQGAAVGAGAGLLAGSVMGVGAAQSSGYEAQRQYDHAYIQCMYAAGERVPISGNLISAPHPAGNLPPPPPGY